MGAKTQLRESDSAEIEDQAESTTIARDQIFEVLSNERRQRVLRYLSQHNDRSVELRELVDHVAALENDTSIDQLDSRARKSVYTALRQSHLPKLADRNVIEYDRRRGQAELTDEAKNVLLYLQHPPKRGNPWPWYYLTLSGILGLVAILAWMNVAPFSGLSALMLTGVTIAVFVIASSVHAIQTFRFGDGIQIDHEP